MKVVFKLKYIKGGIFINKVEKAKACKELYGLIDFYLENRDQPVQQDFDFHQEVKKLCHELDLDYDTIKKEFNLTFF